MFPFNVQDTNLALRERYLGACMNTEHAVVGRVVGLRVVVRRDELVVVLAPREDGAPVGQRVRHYGQAVAPRLHYGLHVVEGCWPAVQQTLCQHTTCDM